VLHNEELSLEKTMASTERESITEVWGRSPQRGPRQSPLSGIQGDETPWSWWHLYIQSAFPALFLWHFALVQRLQISVSFNTRKTAQNAIITTAHFQFVTAQISISCTLK